jgi:hypothetical protein
MRNDVEHLVYRCHRWQIAVLVGSMKREKIKSNLNYSFMVIKEYYQLTSFSFCFETETVIPPG